ncbi:tellurium resistance protein [Acinetobacter sp. ANC 4648]|uniref:tellurium resistance protein n=1 Tax=Acinetobacter sp. ANC 4648 TaxID=1977875 RepID=UPI000A33A372|nr:tellurium resistance protein [Acinetobacter sp. ANC 4648]OTG81668.1 tellurium resistance protein [Acinetobacter sp. ANC 4648]
MQQFKALIPLEKIEMNRDELLAIKRNDLVPLLDDQMRMNLYADQLIQAQSVLLKGVDRQLTQKLSQIISDLIQQLAQSKKSLQPKKFNALQKWLGLDLEFDTDKIKYLKNLDQLIDEANTLSQRLKIEIQKSQARFQQAMGYREHMAKYIVAAQEFLHEYPHFVNNRHPLDDFSERLSKKINTLQTLQASNDIALSQMQLTQQLSLGLIDRFKEAQQVLIPAWQYHLKHTAENQSHNSLAELDQSRDKLIQTLKQSLEQK